MSCLLFGSSLWVCHNGIQGWMLVSEVTVHEMALGPANREWLSHDSLIVGFCCHRCACQLLSGYNKTVTEIKALKTCASHSAGLQETVFGATSNQFTNPLYILPHDVSRAHPCSFKIFALIHLFHHLSTPKINVQVVPSLPLHL